MKKNLLKAFAVCAMMTAFVACSDDNDTNVVVGQNEIAGTYVSATMEVSNPLINEGQPTPMNFVMDIQWADGTNAPMVGQLPADMVIALMNSSVSSLVAGGLQELTLGEDGSISAQYKDLKMKGTDMGSIIGSLLQPEFETVVKTFPSEETNAVLPADAVAYEASALEKIMYFRLSKKFIDNAAAEMLPGMSQMLEGMIQQNKLPIKVDGEYFGIPMKYTIEGNSLKLYTDRDMALPYLPMISALKAVVPPVNAPMVGEINVMELLENIIKSSKTLNIILPLEKK